MKTVKIETHITIDVDATDEQITEFVRYELREIASIQVDNPLSGYDLGSFAPDFVDVSIS